MQVTTIGIDLAKTVFQIHAVDADGATVIRKRLRRAEVVSFFAGLEPCLIGMEACATSHYWARELAKFGHTVADASGLREALCQAREERRHGCGGDLRGGHPAEHAVCAGQERRPASCSHAASHILHFLLSKRTLPLFKMKGCHMSGSPKIPRSHSERAYEQPLLRENRYKRPPSHLAKTALPVTGDRPVQRQSGIIRGG
jgi:hypothetical protein